VPGLPLLAGVVVAPQQEDDAVDVIDGGSSAVSPSTTATVVARWRRGLTLPGPQPASGLCGAGAASLLLPSSPPPLAFGFNASSACGVALSREQLKAACVAGDAAAALRSALGAELLDALTAGRVRLGVWGDADAGVAEDWVALEATGWPSPAPVWDDAAGACSGVVAGARLRLLTGLASLGGNGVPPQRKLLHARVCFSTATWVSHAADAADNAAAQQQQHDYTLEFGADFVALPQTAERVYKAAPPLLRPLPPDLFYPFVVVSASSSAAAGVGAAAAATVAVAALMVVL
jgi:tectonic-1/3